jgi:hypothetical protein
MSANKKKKTDEESIEFFDYCALSQTEAKALALGTDADRRAATRPLSKVTTKDVTKIQPMPLFNHIVTVLFLAFGVPNGVFTIPAALWIVGKFVVHNVKATFQVAGLILLPLTILPQPFIPSTLTSWMAMNVVKYFSFRFIGESRLSEKDLCIFVAPPHGVFPYGNILSMLVFPATMGFSFKGLAASSALRVPIFKQILRSIGIIDASRNVAMSALRQGHSIGISTGGVREVFETNEHHECILLKERIGMIKLAIKTGANLVPVYEFGNTHALSMWAGEGIGARGLLERISRKVGFALIIIYGRFGLPIPYRVPILGVMGKPIKCEKCDDPTSEQIFEIQAILLKEMQELFERYKDLYGWSDTDLVIK